MADSRMFLYGALAILLFLVWQTWQIEKNPPPPAPVADEAGAALSRDADAVPQASHEDVPTARLRQQTADTPQASESRPRGQRVRVRTDVLDLHIDTTGGSVVHVDLNDFPVSLEEPEQLIRLLYDEEQIHVAQSGLTHDTAAGAGLAARAPNHHARYEADRTDYDFRNATEPSDVTLRWRGPDGLTVRKRFRFTPGNYLVEVRHEIENAGTTQWVGRQYRQLRRSAGRSKSPTAALLGDTQALSFVGAAYYDSNTYYKLAFEDLEEEPFNETFRNGWIAMLQHYFVSAWVPNPDETDRYYTRVVRGDRYPEYIIGMHSQALQVSPGETAAFDTRLYAGPKEQNRLEEIAPGLDLTVDYGILTVLSKPLFWVLSWIHSVVGNWGWAIVLLTVLIKLAFYKLSETSYRSMAKMRKFTPRIKALRERYGSDRAKLNEAMMKIYREEKVNPLGGCWPILVQIPVFLALYWVLLESVELRQAPFIGWVVDLSVQDPYYVLPLLMGASMLVQTRLNPTPPDPFQAKLMLALPVVFTVFFLFFPAGLVLYWLANNLLSIAQQWYIMRRMNVT